MRSSLLGAFGLLVSSVSLVAFAETSPVDWSSLKGHSVSLAVADTAVGDALRSHFAFSATTSPASSLVLKVDSFYRVVYEQQQGFPSQRLSLSDVMSGVEPDRKNFRYLLCGKKIDNVAGKQAARQMGTSVGVDAASLVSGVSNSGLVGAGLVVGLVAAIATPKDTELSCEEPVAVCPVSAYFCSWKESVVSNFSLFDGERLIAQSSVMTHRIGRGLQPKQLAEQHLKELQSL